jgi:hypothetical protein
LMKHFQSLIGRGSEHLGHGGILGVSVLSVQRADPP